MARAGAKIIGVNCLFDPFCCLETIKLMKEALDEAGAVRVNIDIIIYLPIDFRIEGSFDGTAFRIQNSRCCKFWLGIITRISIRLTKINCTN